jgi:hypothetical protein
MNEVGGSKTKNIMILKNAVPMYLEWQKVIANLKMTYCEKELFNLTD